jgi:hypothetical protein
MLHPVDFVPFWSMLCGTEVSTLHKYVIPGSKSPPDVPLRWLPTPDCHFSSLMVCWLSASTGWLYLDGLLTPVIFEVRFHFRDWYGSSHASTQHWIQHHEAHWPPSCSIPTVYFYLLLLCPVVFVPFNLCCVERKCPLFTSTWFLGPNLRRMYHKDDFPHRIATSPPWWSVDRPFQLDGSTLMACWHLYTG